MKDLGVLTQKLKLGVTEGGLSPLAWNACRELNLVTVQDLLDIFSAKNAQRYRERFVGKNREEILEFFRKNKVSPNQHGKNEISDARIIIFSRVMLPN